MQQMYAHIALHANMTGFFANLPLAKAYFALLTTRRKTW